MKLSRCFTVLLTMLRTRSYRPVRGDGSANLPDGVEGTCKVDEDPPGGFIYISDGFGLLGDVAGLPAVGRWVVKDSLGLPDTETWGADARPEWASALGNFLAGGQGCS
jgi:hypothetical protein